MSSPNTSVAVQQAPGHALAPPRTTPPAEKGAPDAVAAPHAAERVQPKAEDMSEKHDSRPDAPRALDFGAGSGAAPYRHTESSEEDSAQTPSPILGRTSSGDDAAGSGGHLTFPQVDLGLGKMDHDMQLLIGADEDFDELGEKLGALPSSGAAGVSEIATHLEELGFPDVARPSPESTEDKLAATAWDLVHRSHTQNQAQDQLRHLVRVTRRASLSMLSSLRISYAHMLHAERDIKDRLEVELYGSKNQSKMLSDMVSRASLQGLHEPSGSPHDHSRVSSGTRLPNGPLHEPIQLAEPVPTSTTESATLFEADDARRLSPLVNERNKLLADKRYLRQRVRDAEAQVVRLEAELKSLRPMLLRQSNTELGDTFEPATPANASRTPARVASTARRRREATMGDAETEHLILAARMLRTLRHRSHSAGPSPSVTTRTSLDVSPSKPQLDAAIPSTPRAYPPSTPRSVRASGTHPRPSLDTSDAVLQGGDAGSARAHVAALSESPTRPSDGPWSAHNRHTSGIDDLLHAAKSLTGPAAESKTAYASPTKRAQSRLSDGTAYYGTEGPWTDADAAPRSAPVFGSPKRRRVSPTAMDIDTDRLSTSPTRVPSSALDLLADQAASEVPSRLPRPMPQTPSGTRMHAQPHASAHQRSLSSHAVQDRRTWSPTTKPPMPASESKAGSNQSPEKRLPYVRWSAEEDIKLRRAIKEHGQRWEFVARAVGTRSYHQCRQRYLLMRRKEAAANGLTSPSRPQSGSVPRTPSRAPSGSQQRDASKQPGSAGMLGANEHAGSSSSDNDINSPPRGAAPRTPGAANLRSPAVTGMLPRYAPVYSPVHTGSPSAAGALSSPSPRAFQRGQMSPALYS